MRKTKRGVYHNLYGWRKTKRGVKRKTARSHKYRAGTVSYMQYIFKRWKKKYNAGINLDLSMKKLTKAQKSFANDIVTTLELNDSSDTYNNFIKSLSKLTDKEDIESYLDFLNNVQQGDIPFYYVNQQIKRMDCKYEDECTRQNPLHKVQAHYLDWTEPLIDQLNQLV